MSDPLDPIDSLFSGMGSAFLTFGAFLLISFCGHTLASPVLEISQATTGGGGAGALWAVWQNFDAFALLGTWLAVFLMSTHSLWGVPFLLADVYLLASLRSGHDSQRALFILAVTQPIHTFIIGVQARSLTGGQIVLGAALLAVSIVGLAFLLLWWRAAVDQHQRSTDEAEFEL